MAVNFTQALVNARRRASISGRPLSQQETAGIAAGEASTSSERAARLKALRLQEQQLAQQNAQFRDKMRFDEKQAEREERAAIASGVGGAIGVGAGYYIGAGIGSIGGPVGAIIGGTLGSAVGGAFSNTHLCTEASHVLDKIDNRHLRAYQKLRYYAKENFPACYRFYNDRGSEIIAGIQDAFPEPRTVQGVVGRILRQDHHSHAGPAPGCHFGLLQLHHACSGRADPGVCPPPESGGGRVVA
jgi:hypothetical protein